MPLLAVIQRKDPDLARQGRRAVTSTPLNIAEGSDQAGKRRGLHYRITLGSARETVASSPGHGASPSQGHGARETERTTASEPASDRSRRPLVAIGVLGEASDEIFAGSWGQSRDHRRRFERRRSEGCFIAGAFGGGSASSIFGLSLERYDSPSTTKS